MISATSDNHRSPAESTWIFGYGSLIWRPDFDFLASQTASLEGWQRQFWQGSHDHRGTPESPGRVVTLMPAKNARCDGVAYRVAGCTRSGIFAALDHREKNGYERHTVTLTLADQCRVSAMMYRAAPDNPAWLGHASLDSMARQIISACGPSGPNREYLLKLDEALDTLGLQDRMVADLATQVRTLMER